MVSVYIILYTWAPYALIIMDWFCCVIYHMVGYGDCAVMVPLLQYLHVVIT